LLEHQELDYLGRQQAINCMIDFVFHNHEIIRPGEEAWLARAKACQWGDLHLSEESTAWLDFQALIRRLLSDLVNGISALSGPTDVVHYFTGNYKWWRVFLSSRDSNLLRQRGLLRSEERYLDLPALLELLKRSEEILMDVPEDIPLEKRVIEVNKDLSGAKLSNLLKHCKGMDSYFSLYIHGSRAIGDYTHFSDIDDLLIVHSNAWQNLRTLKQVAEVTSKLARVFQDIDPLQHHGHWVYSDFDLLCFDESIMPLIVLDTARILCGRYRLEVFIRPNPGGFRRILWSIIQEVRRDCLTAQSDGINLYFLKNLISGISLLPALTFQVLGQMIDKKSAILRSREIYSEQACEAIHWASHIRENWAQIPTYGYLPVIRIVAKILAPKKRHMAEIVARQLLPAIPPTRINGFEKVFPCILRLTDESAERLREVVLHETS